MTVDSIANYLSKVECRYCGSDVYSSSDRYKGDWFEDSDVYQIARQWVSEGVETIDDVRDRVSRTCDGCRHFLDDD
jgi:hypothetical protein